MERNIILGLSVAFVAFVAFLTVSMLAENGFGVRAIVGIVVLAILALGVYGAISSTDE
jgi:hypothetical protein